MKKTIIALLVSGLAGCGAATTGDGTGGTGPQTKLWQGALTAEGYPDVAGEYSFVTDKIALTCSDGSESSVEPLVSALAVTQTGYVVKMESTEAFSVSGGSMGATIIEQDDTTGIIELDGDFTMKKYALLSLTELKGNMRAIYTLTGSFNQSGWSGEYKMNLNMIDYGITCAANTHFRGDKSTVSQ